MRQHLRLLVLLALAVLLLASVYLGNRARLANPKVQLFRVAEVNEPVDLATRRGDAALYVATRMGTIYRIARPEDPTDEPKLFLDLSNEVFTRGIEPGLLGLTFSPDGKQLFVTFTGPSTAPPSTEPGKPVDWKLIRYDMRGRNVDAGSRTELLLVHKPWDTHNGGDLTFGPDGNLYVGIGDGTARGDMLDTGQDPKDLLGSLLRIDPKPSRGDDYSIPKDNPFVDGNGAPEVWLYGLRNPWRVSFDRETGDLWVTDVGDHDEEEITLLPHDRAGAKANLGWPIFEGNKRLRPGTPAHYVAPTYAYTRELGCAVIGGFVYRGDRIRGLRGAYVYTDLCQGVLRALTVDDDEVKIRDLGATVVNPTSFGEARNGELYVLSQAGPVYRIDPA